MEESNFNFRYARLGDLHIPREKWINYLQTVETLIRRRVLRRLIWVCTVCQIPFYGSPDYNGLYNLTKETVPYLQYRSWSYATFCGVWSGITLFAKEAYLTQYLRVITVYPFHWENMRFHKIPCSTNYRTVHLGFSKLLGELAVSTY